MKKILEALAISALLLAQCLLPGCGSANARPLNVCLQPGDRVIAMAGCDAQIQPLEESDPVKSVARQAALGGPVILWIGRNRSDAERAETIANYPTLIAEAAKRRDVFQWVYAFDEMNLCPTGPCLGRDDALVHQATQIAHAAGLRTIVTITPSVVMTPGFVLPDSDAISMDEYPATLDLSVNLQGCRFDGNPLSDQWFCAKKKLRAMGFTGMVGYVWQAFGLIGQSDASLYWQLLAQRQTINSAEAMGADAVMAYDCHLSNAFGEAIKQLCGTPFEGLVQP